MKDLEREAKYLEAKERVACIKKFYTSLMFYIVFVSFLAALNYYTNEWNYPWFLWAAFGWGIGITIQAFKTFSWLPYMNKKWEERKIKEIMDKDNDSNTESRWS